MAAAAPSVYILNGEDDFAIAQIVEEMERSVGDASTASMNITRLDGATYNPEQLLSIAAAMPFLARRRLVILTHPLAKIPNSEPAREKFRKNLEQVPATTALLLIEHRLLTEDRDRQKGKVHWLERWGTEHPDTALVKTFRRPKEGELVERTIKLARAQGAEIDRDAAHLLVQLVDGNMHIAAQELPKLRAYVNYQRPIRIDDVHEITADTNEGDVFALVDAFTMRNSSKAMEALARLLEYNTYYELIGMVVRQFRLLIEARDVIDGGSRMEAFEKVERSSFVVRKSMDQARNFSMAELEAAFRRLVQVDEAVKTSQAPEKLALEYFVSSFTTAPDQTLLG